MSPAQAITVFRALQAVSGALTLLLSVTWLRRDELGTYQTMVNLASLSMIFEMGVSLILVQLTASAESTSDHARGEKKTHAWSSLTLGLIKTAVVWCAWAGLLFLCLIPLGGAFLGGNAHQASAEWLGPWCTLVILLALQMPINALLAGMEGTGFIPWVYTLRIMGLMLGIVLTWFALWQGWKYWAACMAPFAMVLVTSGGLWGRQRSYLQAVYRAFVLSRAAWRSQMWPLQWRSAMGWLAGYAQIFVHVPILYHFCGPVEAGRFGVTMTMVNMVSVVALAYPVSHMPALVAHATRQEKVRLNQVFSRVFRASMALYVLGASAVSVLCLMLQQTHWHDRILPLGQVGILLLAVGFYHAACVLAYYVRAHLQDPVAKLALAIAGITLTCSVALSPRFGTQGVVWAMLGVNALIYLPACWIVFKRYRANSLGI